MYNSTIKTKFGICQGFYCQGKGSEVPLADVKRELCSRCKKHERAEVYTERANKKPKKKKVYRIPNLSQKRLKINAEYRIERNKYMAKHPICEAHGCNNKSNDLHHRAKRGKNLVNVETFMAVCRTHHNWIHNNPRESKELGYLI